MVVLAWERRWHWQMLELNFMPGFRDQQTQQLSLSFPEHWNTIRMPIAITTDIITMAIADTITARITTATGINV